MYKQKSNTVKPTKAIPKASILPIFFKLAPNSTFLFQKVINRYGHIVQLPGLVKNYLVNTPEAVQYILQTHAKSFTKADTNYRRLVSAIGNGLLTNPGDETWLSRRRLLQPNFHIHNLQKYDQVITRITGNMLDVWEYYADHKKPFNLSKDMMFLTLLINGEVFFDADLSPYAKDIISIIESGNAYYSKAMCLKSWWPAPANLQMYFKRKKLNAIFLDIIQQHRNSSETKNCLLSALGSMIDPNTQQKIPDEQLIDEMKNFLVAGHETSGTALSWIFYCLMKNPETLSHLQQEFDRVLGTRYPNFNDMSQLTYTKMVIDETLRMYPPIWFIDRRSLEETEFAGYTFPAHSSFYICPYTLHRHPDYWDDPEVFNPERFNVENNQKRAKFCYIPFGLGPRVCIGQAFAMMIMQTIIAMVVQRFELELINKEAITIDPQITLKQEPNLIVRVRKR